MLAGDIILEPLSEETLEFVRQVRSSPEVHRWLRGQRPIAKEEQDAWFERYQDQSELCVYVGSRPGWFFGYSQLQQSVETHSAEVGICIAPYSQGKGLGEVLLKATIAKAWEIGLDELWAFIFSHNTRSIWVFEKCGFTRRGTDKELANLQCWILERGLISS